MNKNTIKKNSKEIAFKECFRWRRTVFGKKQDELFKEDFLFNKDSDKVIGNLSIRNLIWATSKYFAFFERWINHQLKAKGITIERTNEQIKRNQLPTL